MALLNISSVVGNQLQLLWDLLKPGTDRFPCNPIIIGAGPGGHSPHGCKAAGTTKFCLQQKMAVTT
jgi:hypothetical protein